MVPFPNLMQGVYVDHRRIEVAQLAPAALVSAGERVQETRPYQALKPVPSSAASPTTAKRGLLPEEASRRQGHHQAVIALARRRVGVLAMLRDAETTYSERPPRAA